MRASIGGGDGLCVIGTTSAPRGEREKWRADQHAHRRRRRWRLYLDDVLVRRGAGARLSIQLDSGRAILHQVPWGVIP
jgi:hypothetical protein